MWQSLQTATARWLDLRPAVELLLHDVAVGAGRRVVGQVRRALGVDERVAAEPGEEAEEETQEDDVAWRHRASQSLGIRTVLIIALPLAA